MHGHFYSMSPFPVILDMRHDMQNVRLTPAEAVLDQRHPQQGDVLEVMYSLLHSGVRHHLTITDINSHCAHDKMTFELSCTTEWSCEEMHSDQPLWSNLCKLHYFSWLLWAKLEYNITYSGRLMWLYEPCGIHYWSKVLEHLLIQGFFFIFTVFYMVE